MRYGLRTLLNVAAIAPGVLAVWAYVARWLAFDLWLISQPPGTEGSSD